MSTRGFKCTVEVSVESVVSPGAWLPNRDELYLSLELFGQVKRTRLVEPAFPLCLHERFVFEKQFWPAADPQDVLEMLDELAVSVELRQVTDVYLGGCLLAYFDVGARDFLYPAVGSVAALGSGCAVHRGSRQAQMVRTVDFIGPGPRLEFSTRAAIVELPRPLAESRGGGGGDYGLDDGDGLSDSDFEAPPPPPQRRRQRSRSRRAPDYGRQTLAAILRSRSPSPYAAAAAVAALHADYELPARRRRRPPVTAVPTAPVRVDGRPPFVVRRVDKGLVGRKPALHDTLTRLGGPHGPLKAPPRGGLRRSRSSAELHRSVSPAGAGRQYGDEFDEDLAAYRPPSPYVSGRRPPLPPPPPELWSRRYRGESPLRHRLYSSFHRRDGEDGGFYDEDDVEDDLERGLRRVRIHDSCAY